jgi:hypothetical protein
VLRWPSISSTAVRTTGSAGCWPEGTKRPSGTHKREVQRPIARVIKNPRSKLRGIGGRKEADQKNAASCGEYVPKEIKRKQRVAAFRPEPELRTMTVTEW